MVKRVMLLSRVSLIVLLSISNLNYVICQKKIGLSVGIGLPELLNIGIRGQSRQNEVGISMGIAPQTYSVCGDLFCHFGKVYELSGRKVWYVRSGLNFLSSKTKDYSYEDRYTNWNLRFGRDLNLSKHIGIQFDTGVIINLSYKRIPEPPLHSGGMTSRDPVVLPGIGLNIYFQL
jgi:hypothetical protein